MWYFLLVDVRRPEHTPTTHQFSIYIYNHDIFSIIIIIIEVHYMYVHMYTVADPGGGGAGGAPPPFQKNNKKWGPIFVQFCS